MASYGLKATVSCVINGDNYELGVNFSDTEGNRFDKKIDGDIDNIERDLTKAALDVYSDLIAEQQKREKEEKARKIAEKAHEEALRMAATATTTTPVVDTVSSKFAELEEENRRLNQKVNEILNGHTSKPVEEKREEKQEVPIHTVHTDRKKICFFDDDVFNILRLLDF